MNKYKIIIIGGGPAGLTAAISAAIKGAHVCILEHNKRVGQKILSTGNGKCNITNLDIDASCYNSSADSKDFYKVIEAFPPKKVIGFMNDMGLYTKNKNGYIYPNSEQASSVLDTLRHEAERLDIDIYTDISIKNIQHPGKWHINTGNGIFESDKLIIAAGSACAPGSGSDGSGYKLAEGLGHSIIPVIPALCALKCSDGFYKEIQGVRADALLTVYADGAKVVSERGELQLTSYGISGIPVFQLGRHVKRLLDAKKHPTVHIDFMPDISEKLLSELLVKTTSHNPQLELQSAVSGILNKKLAVMLIKEAGLRPSAKCSDAAQPALNMLTQTIKNLGVHPTDTLGFESAQVCAGGVNLDEIDLNTMESKINKNLYFAGEILDVDGRCGGYNLQWAWASGRLAGLSAAEK